MSINVEMIGTGLVIQHYVAEEATPTYCCLNSISDVFPPLGRTQVNVVWELIAERIGDGRSRYTNRVTSHPTDFCMEFLDPHGQNFEAAAAARQEAGGDHNRRETPHFVASIARRATACTDRSDPRHAWHLREAGDVRPRAGAADPPPPGSCPSMPTTLLD